MQLQKEEQGF